ncbi:MAG: lipid-binding SYLF domain-containing protein [Alphaproteobacteria bacterium]|nr:lipid-binding SYLF domain-containing protein [Alphaproteobacteria bacterium]
MRFLTFILMMAALFGLARPAAAASEELTESRRVIERAAVTVERMKLNESYKGDVEPQLKKARAVLIVPSMVKAGFILGGEYGNGALLVRDASGGFGEPAFYKVMTGSVGFQAGIQDAEVLFLIMTDKALNAILENRFKGGAEVSVAVVRGAGIEASTTSNVGADVLAFSLTVGLFAGGSLEGAVIESRTSWNNHYYGSVEANPRTILFERRFTSSDSARLRQLLVQ